MSTKLTINLEDLDTEEGTKKLEAAMRDSLAVNPIEWTEGVGRVQEYIDSFNSRLRDLLTNISKD